MKNLTYDLQNLISSSLSQGGYLWKLHSFGGDLELAWILIQDANPISGISVILLCVVSRRWWKSLSSCAYF